ncbi:hypothetical protein AX16_010592 [Volvariella volvacea WC 439]|nr:hypothetical protein AX16_010592 [Volvariella volvacea WC 439]
MKPTTMWTILLTLAPWLSTSAAVTVPSTEEPSSSPPVNIGMLVFPAFQALDVFGPLDALNLLSLQRPLNLAILSRTLDPVSTRPQMMNPYQSNFSEAILPTHTFSNPPSSLEVLFVPGGIGTRAPDLSQEIQFVKDTYPSLKYLISICTGAGIAARAGVLDGKNATTNKRSWASTIAHGPNVNWITHARWVVDGNVWTSSGVSAGIDATLAWMEHVYGANVTEGISNGMEYERHTNSSWDPFADLYYL